MIALFTDFGWNGPYVGQIHARLASDPEPPTVIDLMHDAPRCNPRASALLLAALAEHLPREAIVVAVVDPGVGTARRPIVVEADGRRFVGPDNGLLDAVSARAGRVSWWDIEPQPDVGSATFHGRDLFAPVAARIERGDRLPGTVVEPRFDRSAAGDLAEIIYIDDFGNAVTGLRAPDDRAASLAIGNELFPPARTFADVAPGEGMWLVNSLGLVEVAVNQGNAAQQHALQIGTATHWYDRRSTA